MGESVAPTRLVVTVSSTVMMKLFDWIAAPLAGTTLIEMLMLFDASGPSGMRSLTVR